MHDGCVHCSVNRQMQDSACAHTCMYMRPRCSLSAGYGCGVWQSLGYDRDNEIVRGNGTVRHTNPFLNNQTHTHLYVLYTKRIISTIHNAILCRIQKYPAKCLYDARYSLLFPFNDVVIRSSSMYLLVNIKRCPKQPWKKSKLLKEKNKNKTY